MVWSALRCGHHEVNLTFEEGQAGALATSRDSRISRELKCGEVNVEK